MRIERDAKRNGRVVRDCISIQYGPTELGPGSLCVQPAVEIRVQLVDQRGKVLLVGKLESVQLEDDGSLRLDFEPVTTLL